MGLKRTLTVCVGPALVALLLGVLAPATAFAATPIVSVPPPNGTNDTANLQAALNACLVLGPGCTVRLGPGTYHTTQLVTFDFNGTFGGAGKDATTIEALPNLPVFQRDLITQGECTPNTTTCPWPSLIIFVNGNIHVSDLSIRITASSGTATVPWHIFGLTTTTLVDALRFMGQSHTDVSIDRVSIEGRPDDSPTALVPFNVINGIIFTGELPRSTTPFDYFFMSGSLTVRNSSFKTTFDGVSQDGFLTSSHITIGGSPSAGNQFDGEFVGIDMESSQSSAYNISYNTSSGQGFGMWIVPWQPKHFTPNNLSRYLIHDNSFATTQPFGTGILLDNETANWIDALISNNAIHLEQPASEGIADVNTSGAQIVNNSITSTGGAVDAIGLYLSTSGSVVVHNALSGFSDAAQGSIFLGPNSSQNTVVCFSPNNAVVNLGTGNNVVGCNGARGAQSTQAREPKLVLPRNP